MLNINDLLRQDSKPGINNVSLELYKSFYLEILMKRSFCYSFQDGDSIIVDFWELGLHHLLGIPHIDFYIRKEEFLDKIGEGLCFDTFRDDDAKKRRFDDNKDRIELFSCIYQNMRLAEVFYVPTEIVKNTRNVKLEYILYREISTKGLNVGLKTINGVMSPISILVDRHAQRRQHLEAGYEKKVSSLIIKDKPTGKIIEEMHYSNEFIMYPNIGTNDNYVINNDPIPEEELEFYHQNPIPTKNREQSR